MSPKWCCVTGGVWGLMKVCNKTELLALFVFVSIINLLSFSLFLEPSRNAVHRYPETAQHMKLTVDDLMESVPEPPSTSASFSGTGNRKGASKQTGRSRTLTGMEALVAPRLRSDVWTIGFPIDRADVCDNLTTQRTKNWTSIVVVVSAPSNFKQRSSVRETWGDALKNIFNMRIVFFVGGFAPNKSEQHSMLLKEVERHSDMVQANFIDHYENLTLKSVLMLRWVTTHCLNASFLLKVDDDVFVHPENLQRVLDHYSGYRRIIFGQLAHRWRPIRDRGSHYYVSKSTWTAVEYPDFVAGPAYVITMDSAAALLACVGRVPYFHLEDVYVTGILAQAAAVRRLDQPGFNNTKFVINPCEQRDAVTSHSFSTAELRAAWDVHLRGMGRSTDLGDLQANHVEYNDTNCYDISECKSWFLGKCFAWKKVVIDFYQLYYHANSTTAHQDTGMEASFL